MQRSEKSTSKRRKGTRCFPLFFAKVPPAITKHVSRDAHSTDREVVPALPLFSKGKAKLYTSRSAFSILATYAVFQDP